MSSTIQQAVSECVHQYERMSYADRQTAIERLQQFDRHDVIASLATYTSHTDAAVRIASHWLLAYLNRLLAFRQQSKVYKILNLL
jgi:hypothetical protein